MVQKEIFCPRSVAIVGASGTPGKIGYQLVKNIIEHGYKGKIFPVNPKAKEILGLKCYSDLSSIPGEIDVIGIVLPAKLVPQILKEAGKKGIKLAVIYSAGFAESGWRDKGRMELQNELARLTKERNIRILGPSTNGFFNGDVDLHMTFNPFKTIKGPLALITQSGGLSSGILYEAIRQGVPFGKFFNMENRSDIDEVDLLEMLKDDENVKGILLLLESFKDPDRLIKVAREATKKKPIIGLFLGTGEGTDHVIGMHTGGSMEKEEVREEVCTRAGIIRVYGVLEALDAMKALIRLPLPKGNRIGMVTNSGGISLAFMDICSKYGLVLPKFSDGLAERITRLLPPGIGYPYNPVDGTANISYGLMKGAFEEIINSEEVDIVVATAIRSFFVPYEHFERSWREGFKLAKEKEISMLGVMMGDDLTFKQVSKRLESIGMPVYPTPERGALALSHLYEYSLIKAGHS